MKQYILITILLSASLLATAQNNKKRVTVNTATKSGVNAMVKKSTSPVLSNDAHSLMEAYDFHNAVNQLQRDMTGKRNKKLSTEQEQRDLKRAQMGVKMLNATQKIIFVDSIITSYDDFLSKIRLSHESGTITTYNKFFHSDQQPNGYVYQNELQNKCYFSAQDSAGNIKLYTSDKLAGKWSDPTELDGIEDLSEMLNYPYMMSDGTTLYFAATGQESLGGYDIFVTRYDNDSKKFLKPENLGMPFNSPANDYMYAEDELNNIGWFVTDRNQPVGKVCIYIFIPSDTRSVYTGDKNNDEKIRMAARINSIKDTWGDGTERQKAILRLNSISSNNERNNAKEEFIFVINDNVTYTSLNDFHSETAKNQMAELLKKKKKLQDLENKLENMRDQYSNADTQRKTDLGSSILNMEAQQRQLNDEVKNTEKIIRNAINKNIK